MRIKHDAYLCRYANQDLFKLRNGRKLTPLDRELFLRAIDYWLQKESPSETADTPQNDDGDSSDA